MMAETFKMLAKTLEGLEGVLAKELKDLGASNIVEGRRSVSFEGNLKLMYEANYWLRTAISILKPIASFKAENEQALYDGIYAIKWFDYFDLGQTFAIDTVLVNSNIDHSQFASYKTKDAIADQFTYYFNQRPDVDTKNADIRISVYISNNECEVSLNSSGHPLFKRGYRQGGHKAPINEVLAAGLIKLSGWDMNSNFIDPMCGSGTLLVEAALMAYNFPPMFLREDFAFKNWTNFDPTIWRELMNDVLSKQREFEHRIIGGDISSKNLRYARDIVKEIRFHKDIELVNIDVADHIPPQGDVKGVVMMNPPYGERLLSDDLLDLYKKIGDAFKQHFTGYTGWVISSDMTALKNIGLKTSRKVPMFNGALECRFNAYDLYEGSKKVKPETDGDSEEEQLVASVDVVIDYEAIAKEKEEKAALKNDEDGVAVDNTDDTVDAEAENDDIFDLYISNKKDEDENVGDRRGSSDSKGGDREKYRGRRDGERRGAFGNRSQFDKGERRDERNSRREDRPYKREDRDDNRGKFKRRDDERREGNRGDSRRDDSRRDDSRRDDKPYRGRSNDNDRGGYKPREDDRRGGYGNKPKYDKGGRSDDRGSRNEDRPYKREDRDDNRGKFKRRDDERREGNRGDSRRDDKPYRDNRSDDRGRGGYKSRDGERGEAPRRNRDGDRPYEGDRLANREKYSGNRGGDKRDFPRRNKDGDRPYEGDRRANRDSNRGSRDDNRGGGNRRDEKRPFNKDKRRDDDGGRFKRRDDDNKRSPRSRDNDSGDNRRKRNDKPSGKKF